MSPRRLGRGRGTDIKGRSKSKPQWVPIPYEMAKSSAWRSLSGPAAKIYIELRSRYFGHNNGDLSLSLDEGSRLLGLGKATVSRALRELEAKRFIVLTKRGSWYGRKATTYAVTDRPLNGNPPTNGWRDWQAPKQQKNGLSVLKQPEWESDGAGSEP